MALGSLPSSVTAGSPSSVTVTISDDDGGGTTPTTPSVWLSVSPNPVDEGNPVTVTATLSSALGSAVTVPLTLTAGTAEPDDYGTLSSITISAGSTTGTGTISTTEDDDTDDETFTVALGGLPSSVTAGNPSSVTVTIRDTTPSNRPPTVEASCDPCEVRPGGEVRLTATASDPDGDELTYAWSAPEGRFGGTTDTAAAHWTAPETAGPVTIRVEVSDARGGSASAEVTIEVNAAPTVETLCDPCEVRPGGEVRLMAMASDPDGNPMTYAWSASQGAFMEPTDTAQTRWRAPAETGRVAVRVEVSDGWGGTAATMLIEVINAPPAFGKPSYTFELRENEDGRRRPVALGAAVAEDPDGDEVSYSLASGDGERFAVGARDGAVTYVGAGEDYEREPNRYELSLRARDPYGAEARAQVVVEVTDVYEAPPTAENDEAATVEDESVVIDVLANDTDPNGYGLRVESVSKPAHGMARAAAGGVAYTPQADYHGTDRFTYVAAGPGGTAEAAVEVTIAPVNDAPRAVGVIPDQTLDEGGSESAVDVSPYFEDVDGDVLTYRASSSDPDVVVVSTAGALVTLTPVVYGSAVVTVTAADPEGLTAEQTFAVGVSDRLVRAVLGDTLAAMARSHLASARMTLRRRVEAPGRDGSRLTVLGRPVPLARGAARTAAGQGLGRPVPSDQAAAWTAAGRMLAGWLSSAGGHGGWPGWPGLGAAAGYGAAGPATAAPAGAWPGMATGPNGVGQAGGMGGLAPGGMGGLAPGGMGGLGGMGGFMPGGMGGLAPGGMGGLAPGGMGGMSGFMPGGMGGLGGLMPGGMGGLSPGGMGGMGGFMPGGMGGFMPGGMGGFMPGSMGGLAPGGMGGLAPGGMGGLGGFMPGGMGGLDAFGGLGGLGRFGGLGAGTDPLRGSEFQLALGGGETDEEGRPGRRWQVWGQGDVQTFAGGTPAAAAGYDGDLRTGYLGVDTALSARWLAGVAVSRSSGWGDWRAGSARGSLSTALTAAYPYVQWSGGRSSVWAAAGGGRGTAENVRETGRVGTSDLGLRLGLVEVRRDLDPVGRVEIALRADAAWARLRTGAGDETVDRLSAAVNQVRAGAEVSRPVRWDNGLSLSPVGEVHVRRDGGAGQPGTGLEVAAGTRLAAGRLRVDAQGRVLVLHSASGYRERGVGVTIGIGGGNPEGLSLSVSPRWGDAAAGGGTLWQEQVYRSYLPDAMGDAWTVDARGEYGMRLRGGGLLTWFGALSHSGHGRQLMVGGQLGVLSRLVL